MKRLRTYMEPRCLSACETRRQRVSHARTHADTLSPCLARTHARTQIHCLPVSHARTHACRHTVSLSRTHACTQTRCLPVSHARTHMRDTLSPCLARGQTSGLHISPQPLHFMSLEPNDLSIY